MNLKEFTEYLDSLTEPLSKPDKHILTAMFYNIYLEGITEGKNQIKDKLIDNLVLLMDTDK